MKLKKMKALKMGISKEQGCVKTDKTLKAFFLSDFFFFKINTFRPEANYTAVTHNANNPALHLINSEAQAHIY